MTALGGRMPHEIALGLHEACGYRPELVAYDVKLQVEPELMMPPYERAEAEHGIQFTFYAPEAVTVVATLRRTNLDGQELLDAAAPELKHLTMTAREAAARTREAKPVAHSVLMIFGAPRSATGARPSATHGTL